MKKSTSRLALLIIVLLFCNRLSAQIPNAGFENWTAKTGNLAGGGSFAYEDPDFWRTTDSISMAVSSGFAHSAEKESGNPIVDLFSLKLTGWPFITTNVPGAASNGDIDVANAMIIKGTPDTAKHGRLRGFYRFQPVSGDTGWVIVSLVKWNTTTLMRDTLSYTAHSFIGTVTNDSAFDFVLQYRDSSQYPDTMVILLATSTLAIGSGHAGTQLWIDDLAFVSTVGLDEIDNPIKFVSLSPVPANQFLNIDISTENISNLRYDIMDLSGRKIRSGNIFDKKASLDVSQLAVGNYLLFLSDEHSLKRYYSGRFSVNR